MNVPAEKLSQDVYITAPMSVSAMHALAKALREADENTFFAGIRE